jgi:hypothetical protein
MSHTPGPWRVGEKVDYLTDEGTIEISDDKGPHWIAHALTTDNASLIAAAPDLLEALKDLVALVDRRRRGFDPGITVGELTSQLVARADAAIAKAERK